MKAIVALLLHIALGIFFVVAIWPAMNGSNDAYSGAVTVSPKAVEQVVVEAEPEIVAETVASVVEEVVTPITAPVTDAVSSPAENENESALYSVVDGNKLDANSYAGFKLYRNWCARCHGTYGQGMVGPNLADSLKIISEKEFFNTVENGKSGTIGSMPMWKANVKVMAGRDQLYAYLMARSDGAIGIEKPKKQ